MTYFTAYLVGSDGWFEYDDGPAEIPDTAIFGWLNFSSADTITSGVAAGAWGPNNQPVLFNTVVNN